jgi:predicted aldo/keto reductase-like oxidoreductase
MSIPRRVLGRTGEEVSVLCLGGWHIRAVKDDNEAIRIMHAALAEGLTFFDNAWEYHWGAAEELMGRAIQGRRSDVFLMTKNCERDYEGSKRCLEESLRRLQTDYVDLWMFHEMVYDNDPEWIYERGGVRAALEAQKEGKVRFLGFTGHKDPAIHIDVLGRSDDWDATLVPINVMDSCYRSFINRLIPAAQAKNVAVLGMKGIGGGPVTGKLVADAGLDPVECYRYCLSQAIASQVVGITSMEQLEADLAIARGPLMTKEEQAEFVARVRDVASDGRFETFKSTNEHDGPHHRKQHGFALAGA